MQCFPFTFVHILSHCLWPLLCLLINLLLTSMQFPSKQCRFSLTNFKFYSWSLAFNSLMFLCFCISIHGCRLCVILKVVEPLGSVVIFSSKFLVIITLRTFSSTPPSPFLFSLKFLFCVCWCTESFPVSLRFLRFFSFFPLPSLLLQWHHLY